MGHERTSKSSALWRCSFEFRILKLGIIISVPSQGAQGCVDGLPQNPRPPRAPPTPNENSIVNFDLASQLLEAPSSINLRPATWVTTRGDPMAAILQRAVPRPWGVEQRAGSRAQRAAQLRTLRLSPAGARAGCRRLLPVQTFLSSSSSRPPHQLLGARRPASPPLSLPRGSRAPGSAVLGAGPTPRSGPPGADGRGGQEPRGAPGRAGRAGGGRGPRARGARPASSACPAPAARGPEPPRPLAERPVVVLESGPPAPGPHLRFR